MCGSSEDVSEGLPTKLMSNILLTSAWNNDLQDWEEGDGDFVAPELLHSGAHAEPSADIFSFGATLYVLATGIARTGILQVICHRLSNINESTDHRASMALIEVMMAIACHQACMRELSADSIFGSSSSVKIACCSAKQEILKQKQHCTKSGSM